MYFSLEEPQPWRLGVLSSTRGLDLQTGVSLGQLPS